MAAPGYALTSGECGPGLVSFGLIKVENWLVASPSAT